MAEEHGYQKYVEGFKRIRRLGLILLLLNVGLIVYAIFAPIFTYEVAGVKGKFSVWEELKALEDVNELARLSGVKASKTETTFAIIPMLFFLFIHAPSGLNFGAPFFGKSSEACAKRHYDEIKDDSKKRVFYLYTNQIGYTIERLVEGLIVVGFFIWLTKEYPLCGIGGYFSHFKGISFFGVIYILFIAVGYMLWLSVKKRYEEIEAQIKRER